VKFPRWAPAEITNICALYDQGANESGANGELCGTLSAMWLRLLTRPEMELIWPWIIRTTSDHKLYDRQFGFAYQFGTIIESFNICPRLSEQSYAKEMREIAAMASELAERLEKLEARVPYGPGDPFTPYRLLPPHLSDPYQAEGPEPFNSEQSRLHHRLASVTIGEHLRYLEKAAKSEEKEQYGRLPVSRKANDFRAYLIREVAKYFYSFSDDFSPSKIATICSVALDDPDITPDLVRKIAGPALQEEDAPRA
jgi:hypothetical protein